MKTKKSLVARYDEREIAKPNRFVYWIFMLYARLVALQLHPKFFYHFDKEELKGKQIILLSDHSYYDAPLFALSGLSSVKMNIVMGYQDLFQIFLFPFFLKMGIIAKRQYVTDIRAVRQMMQVIRMGGSLCFFPEGVHSTTGSNHPINPSTVDLLKTFGVTVVLCKNYGGQCSQPFYKKPIVTKGHQELHYEILFTPEELKEKSCDALYAKLMRRIRYRDFQWAAEHGYTYRRRGETNAYGADNLVYLCPKCGSKYTLNVAEDEIQCTACGNRIRMDDSFALHPVNEESVSPYRNIDDWHKAQRRQMREEVKDPNFSLSYECDLCDLYYDTLRWNQVHEVGEGKVTIDHAGIHYCGTRNGENVSYDFDIKLLPSFLYYRKFAYLYCIDEHTFNIISYHNELFFFRPKKDRKKMVQYVLAVEELHNLIDPVWDKCSRDAYDDVSFEAEDESTAQV